MSDTLTTYQPALGKEECLQALRRAGYSTMDAFAQFLVGYRGGFLINTYGMTNSQIAAHAGLEQVVVDSLMATREFHLMLREHITRGVANPFEQHYLARRLLEKTKDTTDIRQMVAGMKHLDEMSGLGPNQHDNQPKTLIVKYVQDEVRNPYEEYEDPLDAEYTLLDGEEEEYALEAGTETAQETRPQEAGVPHPGGAAGLRAGAEAQVPPQEEGNRPGRVGEGAGAAGEMGPRRPAEAQVPAGEEAVQRQEAGETAWRPKRTHEIDLGGAGAGGAGENSEDWEAESLRIAGFAPESQGFAAGGGDDDWGDEAEEA